MHNTLIPVKVTLCRKVQAQALNWSIHSQTDVKVLYCTSTSYNVKEVLLILFYQPTPPLQLHHLLDDPIWVSLSSGHLDVYKSPSHSQQVPCRCPHGSIGVHQARHHCICQSRLHGRLEEKEVPKRNQQSQGHCNGDPARHFHLVPPRPPLQL